jgi:GNAT superfamily N-acetyltransferase
LTEQRAVSRKASPRLTIRRAAEADLPRIVELLSQLALGDERDSPTEPLPESYGAALHEIEADTRQQLLVVEARGRVVATGVLGIIPNLSYRGRPWAFAEGLVVDPTQRRKGYGEALMRYAIEEARRAGCYKVSLTSNKRRSEAHFFYQKLGFAASHEGFRLLL